MAMYQKNSDVAHSGEPENLPVVDPPTESEDLPIERIPTFPLPDATTTPPIAEEMPPAPNEDTFIPPPLLPDATPLPPSEMLPPNAMPSSPPLMNTPIPPGLWDTTTSQTIETPASESGLPPLTETRVGSKPPEWLQLRAKRRRNRWLLVIALLLIVILVYGFVLRGIIPSLSAVIHIIPKSQTIKNDYIVTGTTGVTDGSAMQMSVRQLIQESSAKSVTVKTTGRVHLNATTAHGTVNVTVLQGSVVNLNIHIISSSGVGLTIDVGTLGTGQSGNFQAFVDNAGTGGNIPAGDINGDYNDPNGVTIISAQNPAAFSNGQDARDVTAVQQSDIDSATQQVEGQFNDADTTTTQNATQNQLTGTEQLVDPVQCGPNPSPNHQVNDASNTVTVSATIECTGVAYDPQVLLTVIAPQLETLATTQLGDGYALVGQVVLDTVSSGGSQLVAGQMMLTVTSEGIWAYEFSGAQQRTLASQITGKRYEDGLAWLKKQPGIAQVNMQTSGFPGTALPASAGAIQMIIAPVKGL